MTNERDPFEGDALVTEAYGELSTEKTPEHLDQAILGMAAEGRKRTGTSSLLFASWMKPVAWAATIGLSLAIVLELTQVPMSAVQSGAVPAAESIREEALFQDANSLEKAEKQPQKHSAPNRQVVREDELGRSADALDDEISSAVSVAEDIAVFRRETKGKNDAVSSPAQSPPALKPLPVSATELAASPPSSARKRASGLSIENESMASVAEQKESDVAASCDSDVRLSADDWLRCIDELRQSGSEEAANLEYEAFIIEYPIQSDELEPNK
jgi:hypothetical protein